MANNKSKTSLLYEQRLYYKYNFFSNIENKIDFWSQQRYYGMLDKKAIPFYLDKQYLKSISTPSITNPTNKQLTLNIVSDSLKELFDEFRKADLYHQIPKSIYNPLKIKRSSLVFEDEYTNYFRQLLQIWYEQLKNKIDNEITTFDEFIRLFVDTFINIKAIITQSSYLTSYLCSSSITGLSIELSDEKHDEDPKKINSFIKDQNFDFFVNTAGKYGFMVDKNAPWRLVYNLSSQYAVDKMNSYGIMDLDDLFSKYYVYPHLTEYTKLRDELVNFYSSKVKSKPMIQKSSYCHRTKGLIFETIQKSTETSKDDVFWIQMYYFIRSKEEEIGMTQSQFDADLKKIAMTYNSSGVNPALEWIQNKTKKFLDGGTNPSYIQYKSVMSGKGHTSTSYNLIF
jgi:hypothetical protein